MGGSFPKCQYGEQALLLSQQLYVQARIEMVGGGKLELAMKDTESCDVGLR